MVINTGADSSVPFLVREPHIMDRYQLLNHIGQKSMQLLHTPDIIHDQHEVPASLFEPGFVGAGLHI
jgi:hypothetical protein